MSYGLTLGACVIERPEQGLALGQDGLSVNLGETSGTVVQTLGHGLTTHVHLRSDTG